MDIKHKLKRSRFILSCIFFAGYAAYAIYAVFYYKTFRNALSIALLILVATTFTLSATITFLSYRINLKNAPRPKLHRFIKMAKYIAQLLSSAISIGLVLSAVYDTNAFSLAIAIITIPFLLWGLFVNVLAEFFEHKYANGFGRRVFIPTIPKDEEGNDVDLNDVIAKADGLNAFKRAKRKRFRE